MSYKSLTIALCLAFGAASLSCGDAQAASSPEQAQKLQRSLQGFFGNRAGVYTVTPLGDGYEAVLDLNVLMAPLASSEFVFNLTPLRYKMQSLGGGRWQFEQDQPLQFTFVGGNDVRMSANIGRVQSRGVYDETLRTNIEQTQDISDVTANVTLNVPPNRTVSTYQIGTIRSINSAIGSADGIDYTSRMEMRNIRDNSQTAPAAGAPSAGVNIRTTIPLLLTDASIKNYRSNAIADLIIWAIEQSEQIPLAQRQDILKQKLRAIVPVFSSVSGSSTVQQMQIETDFGSFSIERLATGVEFGGLVRDGKFRVTYDIAGFKLPPGLVPPNAEAILPRDLRIDVSVSDYDLATLTNMVIDAISLDPQRPAPDFKDDQVLAALLPSRAVAITLGSSRIAATSYELQANGRVNVPLAGDPVITASLSLQGMDELIRTAQNDPQLAQSSLPVLLMLKGLGRTESNGRIFWDVSATGERSLFVNGADVRHLLGNR